ncbi:hypothetical protein [Paraburkholderia sp.]|uniref:hypothetical protein n=1 Tax=Paraburkholderia sp. TaxID=1926495 RepID=UPI0039E54724
MKIAFFKGTKTGLAALFDIGVHAWEQGNYAHVELILSDGRALSSTFLDGGVRFAPAGTIGFDDTTQWDVIDLGDVFDEAAAIAWGTAHDGDKYDCWGDAHFVCGFIHEKPNEEFCSEAVGAALGFEEAWRLDPNALAVAVKRIIQIAQKRAA